MAGEAEFGNATGLADIVGIECWTGIQFINCRRDFMVPEWRICDIDIVVWSMAG